MLMEIEDTYGIKIPDDKLASFVTVGDLVESIAKRYTGIKDSGNILPGHGGMLDRFDSSLLAIPAVVVYLFTLALL